VRVTLIDRKNYHLFQPLLYQVATAALSPGDIAQPIRTILRSCSNVHVRLAQVTAVDPAGRRVMLSDSELAYDYLILAPGASHSYFGHEDWAEHAPGLKTIEDALEIRNRTLLAFERAENEADSDRRRALITFVVVGGGPTGVELAGALAEIALYALNGDFKRIDPRTARVVLLEAAARILLGFEPVLSAAAQHDLERLDVQVHTSTPVTRVGPGVVEAGSLRIDTQTILWAAGVVASPLAKSLGVPLDRAGRVRINSDLTVLGNPEIQVIGDMAALEDKHGLPLPGMAPVAIAMGRHAAANIQRLLKGKPTLVFHYRNRGMMATIGRHAAVAQIGSLYLKGFVAWLAWLFIHLLSLCGFRNRLIVFLEWTWSYITFKRGVRLITGDGKLSFRG